MTFPFPAQGLGSDSVEHAHPSGNDSENIAPFTPARRHNGITTPDAGSALDGFLQEVLRIPKTSAAAIALDTGDYVECQASRGQSAPPPGTRCYPGIGLTGMCLSTGAVQVCNNTDDDPRVNRQAFHQLDVRSVLVAPIRHGSAVVGVLAALSSEANTFNEQKQRYITNLAEQVGSSARQSLARTRHNQGARNPPKAPELVNERRATPYSFEPGQKTLTKILRYRSVAIAGIFLAVLLGSYRLTRYAKMARSAQTAAGILGSESRPRGTGLAHESDLSRQSHGEAQPQPPATNMLKADKMSRDPLPATSLVRMATQVTPENPNTQYELEARYSDGRDSPPTYESEMAQFEETAKKGDADAGWKLGLGYLKGIGVGKDETRAAEWFKKAANLGDVRAQTAISDLYFTGVGVRRDYVRAYTWASIAASGWGDQNERLKTIGQRMTAAQLKNANRRTEAWFAQKHSANGQDPR